MDYHLLKYCPIQTTWYLGGVRKPTFLVRYLPKIEVRSAVFPNFSFRQLPSDSVGFRGLPSPHILLEFRQHGMWEWGEGAKVTEPIFT